MNKKGFYHGELPDPLGSSLDRYGVYPMTVWPIDHSTKLSKTMKRLIGDDGTARGGGRKSGDHFDLFTYNKGYISIYSPQLATTCLSMYAPKTGVCYDPFAGGGTRMILTAKHGLRYMGCEIRQSEIDAANERAERVGIRDMVELHCTDARNPTWLPDDTADFVMTCPPYWRLEQYGGGPDDLSEMSYEDFCEAIYVVIQEQFRVMKPGAYACWTIGLCRKDNGEMAYLNHVVAEAHRKAGFMANEEIIVYHRNNGAIKRCSSFEQGYGHLIRNHEYVMVFVKPDGSGKLPPCPRIKEINKRKANEN